MGDRGWIFPGALLTGLSAGFAFALIPDYSGVLPALLLLPAWMAVAAILGALYLTFRMMTAGVTSPIAHLRETFDAKALGLWLFCILLAGLNMVAFMWVKPLLNYLVPFWADPMLADVDRALFLGRDPWTLLGWMNSNGSALFYHRFWFALMIFSLVMVLAEPPSLRKSAMMLTYFALWSVVGPIVHCLLPAAGPVFYEHLGYGTRFASLQSAPETAKLADYLWRIYSGRTFGPGSGISAMPSLHIAMVVWMGLAFKLFWPRWLWLVALLGTLIFLLSVSLGWHYAVDGIIGGGLALFIYRLALAYYRRERRREPSECLQG